MNIHDLILKIPGSPYKGLVNIQGILVGLEHLPGEVNPWSGKATIAGYGEIPGTLGGDGDPVDVLLGEDLASETAYVVQQRVPAEQADDRLSPAEGGPPAYDEDKVVIGASSQIQARELFNDYYRGARREIGDILEVPMSDLLRLHLDGKLNEGLPMVGRIAKADGGPGAGWLPIPGGKHGGYRRPKAGGGYDYWYPDQEVHKPGHDWLPDPTKGVGTRDLKPGALVIVHGLMGNYRWTPEHGDEPAGKAWVTSEETGEHRLVRASDVQGLRQQARPERPPKPPKGPAKPPQGGSQPPEPPGQGGGRLPDSPGFWTPGNRPPEAVDDPHPDAPRVPAFADSQAKPGTILHKIENGAYALMRYQDGQKWHLGMYIPKSEHAAFLAENRALIHSAAAKVAKEHGIKLRDAAGPTLEYEELYSAASLGLVLAIRSYRGQSPFIVHAQRYASFKASEVAKNELGRGAATPRTVSRLMPGFLAARSRAYRGRSAEPRPEDIAESWKVKKAAVTRVDLGRVVGPDEKVTDQGDEDLPMGRWRVKGPDGKERGPELPGKLELIDVLQRLSSGENVPYDDVAEYTADVRDNLLPHGAGYGLSYGSALALREELSDILTRIPADSRDLLVAHWGLDEEPLTVDRLSELTGMARTSVHRKIQAAVETFKRAAKGSPIAPMAASWVEPEQPDRAKVEGPTQRELLADFGGDNPGGSHRLGVYMAALHAGEGTRARRILQDDVKGEADPADMRRLTALYLDHRDNQRFRAFQEHGRTRTVPDSQVRDLGDDRDPGRAELHPDDVIEGYMLAIARNGHPKVGTRSGDNGGAGRPRVWTQERLDRFLGRKLGNAVDKPSGGDNGE